MIIQLSPQAITFEGYIEYSFIDEVLEIEIKYHEDVYSDLFDFSGLPDGILDTTRIESELPTNPIISASKANGVFEITLLFWNDMDEQDERLLFPEPMSLNEFNDLMAEMVERDKEVESGQVYELENPDNTDEDEIAHINEYNIDLEEVDF